MPTVMQIPTPAVKRMSGWEVMAGVWLLIAPYLFNYSGNGGSVINDVVVGLVVILMAGMVLSSYDGKLTWPSWINALLGLWLVIAPFSLGFPSGSAAMWNDLIVGIVIVVLAIGGAIAGMEDEDE